MSQERNLDRIRELEQTLSSIAHLGGNLPDERLTDKTGPNDAVARGLMYTEARRQALQVLHLTLKDLWK
jgi:hypothetical protein